MPSAANAQHPEHPTPEKPDGRLTKKSTNQSGREGGEQGTGLKILLLCHPPKSPVRYGHRQRVVVSRGGYPKPDKRGQQKIYRP